MLSDHHQVGDDAPHTLLVLLLPRQPLLPMTLPPPPL
jgi:hypothetical protein